MLSKCLDIIKSTNNSYKDKLRIFIGSSVEGLDIAQTIQSLLKDKYLVDIWNKDTVFKLGTVTIEALEDAINQYDFGIFVFTPDDNLIKRKQELRVPRDNVIFEAGLFIGKLSRFRTFIIRPNNRDIQLPTDLSGLTTAMYDASIEDRVKAIGPACKKIINGIKHSFKEDPK